MKKTNNVVVAYSGGLDTSYCVKYLSKRKNKTVHAVMVNTGGFTSEEIKTAETRAYRAGAQYFEVVPAEKPFYDRFIRFLIYGNIKRNHCYPLSVSAERIAQAIKVIEYASEHDIKEICHGSTGAGNDQIRFDGLINTLEPSIKIITPIRDQSLSRQEEIDYINDAEYIYPDHKAPYSINQGLWGTSVGGVETLNSHDYLPEHAWPTPITENEDKTISLQFASGEPIGINDHSYTPVECIKKLSELASPYGIGRNIHVGDTILGIKGRVGFEAAAPLIILEAHRLLEKHTLGKWQQYWKDQLGEWYGMMLHEGKYLDPVMRNIEAFLESSQGIVTGHVTINLSAQKFTLHGISSPYDLASSKYGAYGETVGGWNSEDVKGFIKINSLADMIYYDVHPTKKKAYSS